MSSKKKFLILWLLPVIALNFFLGHFWSYTICGIPKAIVAAIVPLFVLSKLLAGIAGLRFLL